MTLQEKMLFGRALIEATYNAYQRDLSLCEDTEQCSERHIERMNEILGLSSSGKFGFGKPRRRTVIAIVLAIALLLTGCCATYIYRDEISGFIEIIEKEGIRVIFEGTDRADYPDKIEERYVLRSVLEGYELVKTVEDPGLNRQTWKNADGDVIVFEQSLIGTIYGFNSEVGETEILTVGGQNVYFRRIEKYYYLWCDGKYCMKLESSRELSFEEFEKMFLGIKTE